MCADDLFVKVVLLECDYVSQPAKSLPPEQVQEIFAIFCNLEMMAHQLGDDVERGSGELSVNSGDQYLRRTLVRIVAAHVEGYSFVLKQIVLRLRVPLQAQLSFEELSKLEEVKLDTTGQPVLDEHGSPRRRFLPLLDNFKFANAMFGRLCGSTYVVSYGPGYEALRKSMLVRDRMMHPKAIEDLNVTDTEAMDLQAAWQWHQAEMIALMKGSIEPLDERFGPLLQQGTYPAPVGGA